MHHFNDPDEESQRRYHRKRRSAEASLTSGIVLTIGFGIAWSMTGWWFFIFPLLFAGVMPMIEGIRRLAAARYSKPVVETKKKSIASTEKQILQTAKDENGLVTPALIALKTELTIHEAEKALEEMAQNGYTVMNVTESGRIEYEFPEFVPRIDGESGQSV